MPYIQQQHRPAIDQLVKQLADHIIATHEITGNTELMMADKEIGTTVPISTREGDLNYAITKLLKVMYPNPKYHEYNAAFGMLMCCALEYYRAVIGPYEASKAFENGHVE